MKQCSFALCRYVPRWLVVAFCVLLPFFCFGRLAEEFWNRHELRWDGPLFQTAILASLWLTTATFARCRILAGVVSARRRVLLASGILAGSVSLLLGYVSSDLEHDNFRAVVQGEAYRSGQMSSHRLAHCIQSYGIKSIVNLRGNNPGKSWYLDETNTAARLGVSVHDFGISSDQELRLEEMDQLASMMRTAKKPILIHCNGGADRSAFASALYRVAVSGEVPHVAQEELSVLNGHVPVLRPSVIAMDHSFWRYVSNRVSHTTGRRSMEHGMP